MNKLVNHTPLVLNKDHAAHGVCLSGCSVSIAMSSTKNVLVLKEV